jgi:hypothetical protein
LSSKLQDLPKLVRGLCVTRCYYAKNKRCKCKCKGNLHGKGNLKKGDDSAKDDHFLEGGQIPRTRTPILEDVGRDRLEDGRPIVFDGLDAPLVNRQDLWRFLA